MTEWKTYTLKELSKGRGEYGIGAPAVPFDKEKYTYLRITDINDDGTLNTSGMMSVDADDAEEYILEKNDIVFARTGNSTGRSYFYDGRDGELVYAGFLIRFRLDETKVNPKILKYYTHSKPYYDWVKSFDTGGTRGNINAKTYGDMPIYLPPRHIQDRIVGILGAIDDKIENNRRINTNLELQAQALYKQWFVDFEFPNEEGKPYKSSGGKMIDTELGPIPEGWSVGALSDLADITMGQSPNGKSFNENGEGIVFYQGRTEFGIRYPSIRLYTTEPTRYAEPMSVLLSVRAPVGDINIATQKCCIGRGVASIKSKTDDNAYMYCCLKELRPQLDQYNGEGTVFGSINRKELEGLALCIPKNEVISQFNNLVLGMDRQMLNLFQQTQNLATLRDTLLPKLMNGEIKL